MFSELERLEGYYQIMGFLNGVKEVFSIGSTLDRMNQGIDGVVNYKSCSVENFFESQYGTINTIVSGGSDDIRFKVLRAHIAIAINDGFPVIVLHQGNPYIGSRLRNEFGGVVETNIVDIGSACYDPFYDLDGGAISELVMGAAPKSFDIKHNAKYYIEGVVELLKKSKKKPYFNLLATCPHTTLFDKINDLVGKNQISDSDGQEIKSKLMIGQSESVKIESYFYTLQTQIQPFLYRTKSREKPVNVRKNISNKELLVINIGNIANELYVNVLIEELKRAIAWDEKCFLNVTTSISDSNAIDNFRHIYSESVPGALFVASDGIDDCFSNTDDNAQLFNFYRKITEMYCTHEVVDASNQLGEYLPMLSEKGSKDDMSIALILDIDGMKGVFNPIKVRISEIKGDIDLNVS